MVLSRKPGPADPGLARKPGASAPGSTGARPENLYDGDGLGDTPGPVGYKDRAARTALYLGGGRQRASASRSAAVLKMKVEIVEHPKRSILTNKDRNNIKTSVHSELKRIKKKLKKSRATFTVSWKQPRTLSVPVATPKVLSVYVIETTQSSIQQAIKIRRSALPGVAANDQELANHVSKEAGFNAKKVGGKVSVSFMSITRAQQYKQAGVSGIDKILANIVLHEIGHGMDAVHADKGVMSANTVYGSTGGQLFQYSDKSIKKIDKFLSTI